MRMILAGLLAAMAGAASAQTDTVRLTPGEIPLRVVAEGKTRTPADMVTLTIPISATAQTATAANAATQAAVARIKAALVRLGVPVAAITVGQPVAALGFIGNEADDQDTPASMVSAAAAAAQAGAMQPKRQNSLTMRVALSDLAQLPRVEQALDAIDQPYGSPVGALKDVTLARQAAVSDATARARAEADAYAAALNMRVTRVLAVGQMPASNDLATGWTLYAAIQGLAPAATEVETIRRIQIDYALAPR